MTVEQGIFAIVGALLILLVGLGGKQLALISVHDKVLASHGRKLDRLTTAVAEISTLCEVHFGNPHGGESLEKLKAAVRQLKAEESNPYGFKKVQD